MANWKGPLAVVLNAYDLTSFVTVSTKESLLQNRDFAHFFFLNVCYPYVKVFSVWKPRISYVGKLKVP